MKAIAEKQAIENVVTRLWSAYRESGLVVTKALAEQLEELKNVQDEEEEEQVVRAISRIHLDDVRFAERYRDLSEAITRVTQPWRFVRN